MLEVDIKKPEPQEIFVEKLTEVGRKEIDSKRKPARPTVIGTTKVMDIHRDTLYLGLKSSM
jgi:hypothetical protein